MNKPNECSLRNNSQPKLNMLREEGAVTAKVKSDRYVFGISQ